MYLVDEVHRLAHGSRLRIDQLKNRLRKIAFRSDLLVEVLGAHHLRLVDLHRQVVVLNPFFRHSFEFACLGVEADADSSFKVDGLARL